MNHPTAEELAAEAFGLGTAGEQEGVSRHLRECESCLEEFAWRCMESAAIEEAVGPRSSAARAGWGLPAAAALILAAFTFVLALPPRSPATPAASGTRDVRERQETVSVTLEQAGPGPAVLSVKDGRLIRTGDALEMSGAVQFTTGKKIVIDAGAARVDYAKKTLTLDLSWPRSVDRTRLSAVPSLQLRAPSARSWSEGLVNKTELKDAVARFVFGSVPVPGDNVLLKEVAVTVEAESVLVETLPTDGPRDRQRVAFSGRVRILLPDGSSLDCDEAGWELPARPMPTATFRLK